MRPGPVLSCSCPSPLCSALLPHPPALALRRAFARAVPLPETPFPSCPRGPSSLPSGTCSNVTSAALALGRPAHLPSPPSRSFCLEPSAPARLACCSLTHFAPCLALVAQDRGACAQGPALLPTGQRLLLRGCGRGGKCSRRPASSAGTVLPAAGPELGTQAELTGQDLGPHLPLHWAHFQQQRHGQHAWMWALFSRCPFAQGLCTGPCKLAQWSVEAELYLDTCP